MAEHRGGGTKYSAADLVKTDSSILPDPKWLHRSASFVDLVSPGFEQHWLGGMLVPVTWRWWLCVKSRESLQFSGSGCWAKLNFILCVVFRTSTVLTVGWKRKYKNHGWYSLYSFLHSCDANLQTQFREAISDYVPLFHDSSVSEDIFKS